MENSLDTSFIPQQPLLKVEGTLRRREPVNFPLIIAFVLFFASLAVSGGVYFYKARVDQRVLALEIQLQSKEASLKINDIDRYKAIDARLIIAKKLIQSHVAFSTILGLLEKITAQDVGLTALSYSTDERDGSLKLALSGQAPSYSAIYSQAEAWRKMPSTVRKVEMEMPTLNPNNGIVSFSVVLTVDPSYAKYARSIKGEDISVTGGATGTTTSTTAASSSPAPSSGTTTTRKTP